MSRFVDPSARSRVDLGPCECGGTPHESDWAELRAELTTADLRRALALDGLDDQGVAAGLVEFIPAWNLLGADGEPCPPSADSIAALNFTTAQLLINGLSDVVAKSASPPNGSGALSAASSPESASPTRKRNRTRTT